MPEPLEFSFPCTETAKSGAIELKREFKKDVHVRWIPDTPDVKVTPRREISDDIRTFATNLLSMEAVPA